MAIPIGLQLYSIRDNCKADLPATLAAVAKMGYAGVEFAGYHGRSAGELRKMLDDLGLVCCGTHTGLDTLLGDELAMTVEFNKTLGNRFLIVPSMPKGRRDPVRSLWLDNARTLNEIAAKAGPMGMVVGYHAHEIDFKRAEGQTLWDILASNTAAPVVLQMDTGNAAVGGEDVVACMNRHPGRSLTVHLKGVVRKPGGAPGLDWTFAGEGDLDWKAIAGFCRTVGKTEWFVVEHENFPIPPLDCVARCLTSVRRAIE